MKEKALEVLKEMEGIGMPFDKHTYNSIIEACTNCNDLDTGTYHQRAHYYIYV